MIVHGNNAYTPTPGSSSSASNTFEPNLVSANSSLSKLHHYQQSSSSLFSLQQPQLKQVLGSTSTLHSRPSSRTPILDSPTLVRVERARLRLECTNQKNFNSCSSILNNFNNEDSLERVVADLNKQPLLAGRIPVSAMSGPIKRGLLWQQRDRLFSRWKKRYFVLTRDYLHCFKRASGSSNERASEMGQFIFKVKLVDVENVEWLNRRSYSAIGLLLGREGRVLLRSDEDLEDWFELLEECTRTSKERRRALKIAQGPRSRASLAAPVSHSSLQSNHFGLGGTYSSALDDWMMTGASVMGGTNPFLYSDSVPDLSVLNNENNYQVNGLSTNHSTPQKIPYSACSDSRRYSNNTSQHNSFSNCNNLYGSPRRILINNSFGSTQIVDEETDDCEVELRRPPLLRHTSTDNGNKLDTEWLYRKPRPPTDMRHSIQTILPTQNNYSMSKQISQFDILGRNSGLTKPSVADRPSSYREQPPNKTQHGISSKVSSETFTPLLRGNISSSPCGSFRAKNVIKNDQDSLTQTTASHESRHSIRDRVFNIKKQDEFCNSIKSKSRIIHSEQYDPNKNCCFKKETPSTKTVVPEQNSIKANINHSRNQFYDNGNSNGNINNNNILNEKFHNGSVGSRERYQHPALAAIINDTQGVKFRDCQFTDCQQVSPRRSVNNNPSPSNRRRNNGNPIFGTPTKV